MNLKIETIRKITMFLQNVDVEMIEFVKKRRIKVVKTDLKETRIRDLIDSEHRRGRDRERGHDRDRYVCYFYD